MSWKLAGLLAVLVLALGLSGCIASTTSSSMTDTANGTVQAQAVLTAWNFGAGKTQTLDEYGIFYSTNRDDVVNVDSFGLDTAHWVLGSITIPASVTRVQYLTSHIAAPAEVGTITATIKGLKPGATYYYRFYTVGKSDSDGVRYININEVATHVTSDPTLSSLSRSRGTLAPAFSKTKYAYTDTLSAGTASSRITVIPTLAGSSVQMKVGAGLFSVTRSKLVAVARHSSKVLTIQVTAPDGITANYVVTIKRK